MELSGLNSSHNSTRFSRWRDIQAEPIENVVHPNAAYHAEQSCQSILEWNRDYGLYLLPSTDYDNMGNGHNNCNLISDEAIKVILRTTCKALKKLHKKGIAHGLVSPEHVLADSIDGSIKLSGLANKYSMVASADDDQTGNLIKKVITIDSARRDIDDEFVPPEARKLIKKGKLGSYEPTE